VTNPGASRVSSAGAAEEGFFVVNIAHTLIDATKAAATAYEYCQARCEANYSIGDLLN
jgi:hypothetical protein